MIVSDELNHASIIDGIRLTKAERKVFPHADTDALRDHAPRGAAAPGEAERTVLVITDGVFSMDGDIAPLPGSSRRPRRRRRSSTSTTLTPRASWAATGGAPSTTSTSTGGSTSRSGPCRRRSACSAATSPAARAARDPHPPGAAVPVLDLASAGRAAACLAAIDVLETEPERIERLWANTRLFKEGLKGSASTSVSRRRRSRRSSREPARWP